MRAAKWIGGILLIACVWLIYKQRQFNCQTVMVMAISWTQAGKVECSTDGKIWFPARADGACYLADAPITGVLGYR